MIHATLFMVKIQILRKVHFFYSTTASPQDPLTAIRTNPELLSHPQSEVPSKYLPQVSIFGRPNVGKSALFNRIVGNQESIVCNYSGVTRDRMYQKARWNGREFVIVDTGGITCNHTTSRSTVPIERDAKTINDIYRFVENHAIIAMRESDLLLMVVDGKEGPTAADFEILRWVRRHYGEKPLILAVNKCENAAKANTQICSFFEMGLKPIHVSAIAGYNSGDLLDSIVDELPEPGHPKLSNDLDDFEKTLQVAFVGRPNVGKSSLLNSIIGEDRAIVSKLAGTTRDVVRVEFSSCAHNFVLQDTAGIRCRSALASCSDNVEEASVSRSMKSIKHADVAVLVLDANDGVTLQDIRIAKLIEAEGKACVIALNKWDCLHKKTPEKLIQMEKQILNKLKPICWAPLIFTSARQNLRVMKVLQAVITSSQEHQRRLSTPTVNFILNETSKCTRSENHGSKGYERRIYYGTQVSLRPPTFVLFVNDPRHFTADHHKYIEGRIRDQVGFTGTPLRIFWRKKRSQ